jgi:N6-L-threonylcarbamoyladenine synthase
VPVEDVAASFQKAVIDILIAKVDRAAKTTGIKQITVAGGVAANSLLKAELGKLAEAKGYEIFLPPKDLCVDNGAMIAGVGFHAYIGGRRSDLSLDCRANAPLGSLGIKYKASTRYAE